MLEWYSNKYVSIFFDNIPKVAIRYILPSTPKECKKSIKKYPFINKRVLKVTLLDKKKNKEYLFEIPKGYCYDGASVPRFFWRVIGANTDNKFLIAALIHDVLCENHNYVENDRYFSTIVFERLLYTSKINPFSRWVMKHSVDNFQKLKGWKNEL